ncbi:60S ribosomal protein L36-like [Panonychus citri]|uniref:60S ribosomal protein L36-like n=1 Tax=Panonychus citri TaxID=50023 RepID=UPI0023080ED1|nr:60S ribosomal protein L36-like [Panonychus citri]
MAKNVNKKVNKKVNNKRGFELVVGLKRGHRVTPVKAKTAKTAQVPGKIAKQNKFVREIVREISGHAPYEKRCLELLRISKDKRALKFLKRRLGTHARAKKKRDELSNVLIQQRKATAAAHK